MTHDDGGPPPGVARGTAHLRVFQPLAAYPDAVQARLIAGAHRTRAEVEAEAEKKPSDRDRGLEPLGECLDGRRTVHFHCHRADDIATAYERANACDPVSAYGGIVAVPLIVGQAAGLSPADIGLLIAAVGLVSSARRS